MFILQRISESQPPVKDSIVDVNLFEVETLKHLCKRCHLTRLGIQAPSDDAMVLAPPHFRVDKSLQLLSRRES